MAIHLGKAEVLLIGCTPFVAQNNCHRAVELQKALVPAATLRIWHGDTHTLIEQLLHDELEGAIVSLPVSNEGFRIEIIRRERLVACMSAEHPLAKKTALSAEDLTANLKVFRDPSQHPEAQEVLSEFPSCTRRNPFARSKLPDIWSYVEPFVRVLLAVTKPEKLETGPGKLENCLHIFRGGEVIILTLQVEREILDSAGNLVPLF